MKSNLLAVSKAVPLAFFLALATALISCAGKLESAPVTPVAPGTVKTVGSIGSFQGAIVNSSGRAQAILTMDVWVKDGQTNAQLTVSPDGATALISLNSGNRSFSAVLPSQVSDSASTVSISGEFSGASWNGRVSIDDQTNTFALSQGASEHAAVAVGLPTGSFDGFLKYKTSGGQQAVSLVIHPATDLGSALASTLVSRVSLSGVLKYSNSTQEQLKNIVWDRETSTLSADGSTQTSLGVTSLNCKLSEMNSGDKDVLQCALATSKSRTPVATGSLAQKRAAIAPPYPGPPVQPNPVPQPGPPPGPTPYQPPAPQPIPAPTAAPIPAPTAIPVPVPTPSLIIKNAKDFVGTAVFTSAEGVKQTRGVTLSVELASDITGQAQRAKVTFIIDSSRVGAKFNEGTYNGSTGELQAKQPLSLGALPGLLELSCGGVKFENPQYDFLCHYESSVTNVTGEFHLKSP